jgi:hypothetical protein
MAHEAPQHLPPEFAESWRACQEATPGPWKVGDVVPGEPDQINGTRLVGAAYDAEDQVIAFVHPSTDGQGSCWLEAQERDANASLIALARTALPAVLQALAEARGEVETANKTTEWLRDELQGVQELLGRSVGDDWEVSQTRATARGRAAELAELKAELASLTRQREVLGRGLDLIEKMLPHVESMQVRALAWGAKMLPTIPAIQEVIVTTRADAEASRAVNAGTGKGTSE